MFLLRNLVLSTWFVSACRILTALQGGSCCVQVPRRAQGFPRLFHSVSQFLPKDPGEKSARLDLFVSPALPSLPLHITALCVGTSSSVVNE